jgi:polar amino acid transport system substrate-binding protein
MKKNKIIFTAFLLILLFVFVSALYLLINRPPEKLTISGHPEWAPIMYKENDKIAGAGVEIASKIFEEMGVETVSKYAGNWDVVQEKAKTGEVDMLVAAYKTEERESYMDYSIAYTIDPIVLLVKQGADFNYEGWEDLVDKNGVVTAGDSYGEEFDNYIEKSLSVQKVDTPDEAFNLLQQGDADYFVYALYSAQDYIDKNKLSDQIEILPGYVSAENFYFTFSKESPFLKLLPKFNQILKQYKENGKIDLIIEKYKQELWS